MNHAASPADLARIDSLIDNIEFYKTYLRNVRRAPVFPVHLQWIAMEVINAEQNRRRAVAELRAIANRLRYIPHHIIPYLME